MVLTNSTVFFLSIWLMHSVCRNGFHFKYEWAKKNEKCVAPGFLSIHSWTWTLTTARSSNVRLSKNESLLSISTYRITYYRSTTTNKYARWACRNWSIKTNRCIVRHNHNVNTIIMIANNGRTNKKKKFAEFLMSLHSLILSVALSAVVVCYPATQ